MQDTLLCIRPLVPHVVHGRHQGHHPVPRHTGACKYRTTLAKKELLHTSETILRQKNKPDARSSALKGSTQMFTLPKTERLPLLGQPHQGSLLHPQMRAWTHQQYPALQHRHPLVQPRPLRHRPPPQGKSTPRLRGQHPARHRAQHQQKWQHMQHAARKHSTKQVGGSGPGTLLVIHPVAKHVCRYKK